MKPAATAPSRGQLHRSAATARWWTHLTEFDQVSARRAAWTEDHLPRLIFLGLVDAGVLTVTQEHARSVREGTGDTFPMPSDLRVFILMQQHT